MPVIPDPGMEDPGPGKMQKGPVPDPSPGKVAYIYGPGRAQMWKAWW